MMGTRRNRCTARSDRRFDHDDRVGLASQFAGGRCRAGKWALFADRAGGPRDALPWPAAMAYRGCSAARHTDGQKTAARGLILAFAGAMWASCGSGDVASGGSASSGGGSTVPGSGGSGGSSNTSYDQALHAARVRDLPHMQHLQPGHRAGNRRRCCDRRGALRAFCVSATPRPVPSSSLPTWTPAHKPMRPSPATHYFSSNPSPLASTGRHARGRHRPVGQWAVPVPVLESSQLEFGVRSVRPRNPLGAAVRRPASASRVGLRVRRRARRACHWGPPGPLAM